jgi:hypothetical protein
VTRGHKANGSELMNRKRSRPLDGDECCGEPLPPALAATASAHGPAATSPRTHSDALQWPGCSQGTACAVDSGKVRADEMPIAWLEADAAAVLHGILRSGRNGGKCADGVNGSATLGAAAAALVRADLMGWQSQYQQQQEQRQEEQQQERRQEQPQGNHMQADDRDDEGEEEDDLAPAAWRPPPPLAGSGAAGSGSAADGDEDGHSPGAGGALMAAVAAGAPAPPGWLTWAVVSGASGPAAACIDIRFQPKQECKINNPSRQLVTMLAFGSVVWCSAVAVGAIGRQARSHPC